MDSRIPPPPLHRLHPAITRPPTGKRLALTSPRRPLQHDDRRSLPRLHQPANLPATTLPLDLRLQGRGPCPLSESHRQLTTQKSPPFHRTTYRRREFSYSRSQSFYSSQAHPPLSPQQAPKLPLADPTSKPWQSD